MINEPEIPSQYDTVERERFHVHDDSSAAWAMKKLCVALRKHQRNDDFAAQEIARIEKWAQDVNESLERDMSYFDGLLKDYARRVRQDETDGRKTVVLPYGKITTRPTARKLSIDNEVFIPWALERHPDVLRTTVVPDIAAVKDMLLAEPECPVSKDGELVPGIEFVTREPFSVTVHADLGERNIL
jgi:hypothetical protein